MRIIKITDIRPNQVKNIESMPRGANCRYLRCINGEEDIRVIGDKKTYIAKQWHRKLPLGIRPWELIIDLEPSEEIK